jgi:hypothetical protein
MDAAGAGAFLWKVRKARVVGGVVLVRAGGIEMS